METEGERSGASVWTEDTPQSPPQNYYDILGVPKNADSDQIRRSYRKAALRCHPDKRGDDPTAAEEFQRLSKAYDVLSDEKKRQVYDRYGANGVEMMDKMPFLDVSLILAIKNMFCAITILSGILLLFPIFISMKIDGKLSWSWPAVFIPSFIVLGLVFAGAIFAPMSNDDEEPEDQRASMIVRILQKLYNSAYIGALVAFDVLIALRLESIITCNWGTVFVPWFMIEASNLLSGIASTVSRLREGVHLVVPETLDDEVEHNTASRAFTFSEVLYLVFQDYHFIFLRICQEVMLVEKLDSDTLSWGITFTPLYILIALNLIVVLLGFLSSLPSIDAAERRTASICFAVVFVIIACVFSVFTYLLVRKVSGNDGYPPASVVMIPVFFIFAMLLCCCGCFLPCLLGAGLEASLDQMGDGGESGGHQQAALVPLARRIGGPGNADASNKRKGKGRLTGPSSSTLVN